MSDLSISSIHTRNASNLNVDEPSLSQEKQTAKKTNESSTNSISLSEFKELQKELDDIAQKAEEQIKKMSDVSVPLPSILSTPQNIPIDLNKVIANLSRTRD